MFATSPIARFVGVLAVLAFVASSCGDSAVDEFQPVTVPLANVAALAQLSTGEVLAADRIEGTVYRFSLSDPAPSPVAVARVPVSSDGQRGLLGLVVASDDRVYGAWTGPDDQLVIGRLPLANEPMGPDDATQPQLVWAGFASSTGANGGHLELLSDGRLAIGVGTLRRSALIDDPDMVNGKMLAIDPDAGVDQQPEILSSGWKNPFAFTVTEAGELWVADNEPEDGSLERIGRGDIADGPRRDLDGQLAPAALVELGPDRLGVCSFITGELRAFTIDGDRLSTTGPGPALGTGCRTAALVIDDQWILTSDQEQLRLQLHPDR
jgi:hypothetical protein